MQICEIMSKVKNSLRGSKNTKKFIPNLTATPNHVCFQHYEEGNVYKENIRILNKDLVKTDRSTDLQKFNALLHPQKTYHLAIKFDGPEEVRLSIVGSFSKTQIDSGEDIMFEIEFRPQMSFRKESVDRRYEICLNIVNANAKFFIPVLILSPNPVINFPKEIVLPETSVNSPAYSNIFVLNYSNSYQKFSFDCRSEINIIPDCRLIGLKASDGSTFLIEFLSKNVGSFREKIQISFDNGKKASIVVRCKVIPINIFLNEETVNFSPTLIGMTDSKVIHIVNNSDEASNFEWIPLEKLNNERKDASWKYLHLLPMKGDLQPNTITSVSLTFKPEDTDDDEYEVLKETCFSFALSLSIEPNYQPIVNIRGKIVGPNFQLDNRLVEIGSIFLGESRDVNVTVSNIGVIAGKVIYQKPSSLLTGIIKISSKIEVLKPGELKLFKLIFLGRKAGKFCEQVFFKVKNGEKLSFLIQGVIKPLEIDLQPTAVQFFATPICIPQLKLITLKNNLPFDVNAKLEIENNGIDDPLEFLDFFNMKDDVDDSELSKMCLQSSESCSSLLTRSSIKNFMERSGRMSALQSMASAQDGIANVMSRVDEYLINTEIVENIICTVFDKRDRKEHDTKFVNGIIMNLLVESLNDAECSNFDKFDEKDWTFPASPREIVLSKTSFKMLAKEESSEVVKLFLTPNFIGKFARNLKLKILKSDLSFCSNQTVDETIINIPVVYDCQPVELIIHSQVNSMSGYAESDLPLEVLVENPGSVEGFFSFPNAFADHEMKVKCEQPKFCVAKNSTKVVNFIVTPLVSGLIIKTIHLFALGSNRKFSITIECKSLPPDILIKPNIFIEDNLEVLVGHKSKIVMENRGTAKARFRLRLENENEAFDIDALGGILGSNQKTAINIQMLFHDPGNYSNQLIIEIVNSKIIHIPVKCSVRKLPILIEPNFLRLIDFGTVFASKTPYFLEYKLTNKGKQTYMLFVILKSWKNKCSHILVEPNRFEIAPRSSQCIRFYLNAEDTTNVEEEFTIEGCSIKFPMREVLRESVLKASIIRPSVSFSESEVSIDCFYDDEVEFHSKNIKITNKSNLPLPVTLKAEGEFYLLLKELKQSDQKVRLDLKVKESREICVCFNSNLVGKSCVARTFVGKIRAYSLGKLQCTLSLRATIIYPAVNVSCKELMISNNLLPRRACNFTIKNAGAMEARFNLRFDECSTIVTKIQELKQDKMLNVAQSLMKQHCELRTTFFQPDSKEQEVSTIINEVLRLCLESINENESSSVHKEAVKKSKTSHKIFNDEKPVDDNNESPLVSPEVEVTVEEVQVVLKQLRCLPSKCDDSFEVAMPEKLTKGAAEKFLHLSQVAGTLQPHESRVISILFNGSTEAFHLSTNLLCDVVGGASNNIIINLVNCSPNLLITKSFFEISESQHWDEVLLQNVCLSNVSPVHSHVELITDNSTDGKHHLINGYIKFHAKTKLNFVLDEQRNSRYNLGFSVFMGSSAMFHDEIGIQVNDKPPFSIGFTGTNSLQTATLLNIRQNSLKAINKDLEYDTLRKLFKAVKSIRVADEEVSFEDVLKIKTQLKQNSDLSEVAKARKKTVKKDKKKHQSGMSEVSLNMGSVEIGSGDCAELLTDCQLIYDINGSAVLRQKPLKLFSAKMLHMIDETLESEGFEVLDYPDEYPEAVEITNFIAQQELADSLMDDDTFNEFKVIYNEHVLEKYRQSKKSKFPGRLSAVPEDESESCVVPLPLILQHYEIDLGVIQLNSRVEKTVRIYLHGNPSAAALRTETFVPDFTIKFHQSSRHFHTIVLYKMPLIDFHGAYQNRNRRTSNVDPTMNPAMKRFHSFDFNSAGVHSRALPSALERIQIHRAFDTSNSKSRKERSCFVQSELSTKLPLNDATRVVEFQIVLAPSSLRYGPETEFDEFIYLDIHLGPQIPINVKGKVVQAIETADEIVSD